MAITLPDQLLVPIEEQLLEAAGRYLLLGGAAWRNLEDLLLLEVPGGFLTPPQVAPANTVRFYIMVIKSASFINLIIKR